MKHIIKFNETILDHEYIEMCFIDFLELYGDENNYQEKWNERWHMQIFFKEYINNDRQFVTRDIESIIKHNDEVGETLKNIKSCVDKIKIKYPKIIATYDITYNNREMTYKTPVSISVNLV